MFPDEQSRLRLAAGASTLLCQHVRTGPSPVSTPGGMAGGGHVYMGQRPPQVSAPLPPPVEVRHGPGGIQQEVVLTEPGTRWARGCCPVYYIGSSSLGFPLCTSTQTLPKLP